MSDLALQGAPAPAPGWARRLTRRRRTPELSAAAEPSPRAFVLVVGPDGAGKTTVVDALLDHARRAGAATFHAHSRPHLVAGRSGAGVVTDPHGQAPRSFWSGAAKLVVVFADFAVGGLLRWRRWRRDGLLLVERGWHDMAVDPQRYRVPPRLAPLVRLLGAVVPRPDLTVLLAGDPAALHARKPEIGVAEVDRQLHRWRAILPTISARSVEIDTTTTSAADAAALILGDLRRADRTWRRVPLTPERVDLQITGDGKPALAIYQPFSLRARAGAQVGGRVTGLVGRPTSGPGLDIDGLCALIGLRPDGVVAMRSSMPGRHVLGLCREGRMESVLKVGPLTDAALRNEASMLATPLRADLPLRRPEILWAGEWHGQLVLATRIARRSSDARWEVEDVVHLVRSLATAGADGRPLVHGDFAPWNLLRTVSGPVLIDWEASRWADDPLYDLAHFVVQGGALLHRYGPAEAVRLLCDEGSPGARLLAARGLEPGTAGCHVAAYLASVRPTEERAIQFADRMRRLLP